MTGCVTDVTAEPPHAMLCSGLRKDRGLGKTAVRTETKMTRMTNLPCIDAIQVDGRNERPLMIALATILAVWSMALMLTLAFAPLIAR